MLPKEEWLKLAKAVPIGGTRRTYHGAERRPNLVVRNLEDRYTAYCHSCKEGGVVEKELVRLSTVAPPSKPVPKFEFVPLNPLKHEAAIKFLHSKHMTYNMLIPFKPLWCEYDQRIVIDNKDQLIGRDITDTHPSKWYVYKRNRSYVRVDTSKFFDQQVVVLTEDYFSAHKGRYYRPMYHFVALTGTVMYDDLAVELMKAKHVITALDNDHAGTTGADAIHRKLELLNVPFSDIKPDVGKDPKDMNHIWWEDNFPRLE